MGFLPAIPFLAVVLGAAGEDRPFRIDVVDDRTGRGVPLVELRTVHGIRLWTDNNGIVAFREPGLMDEDVFFHVSSHGYEFPKDGFGIRGKKLRTTPGGKAVLKIRRLNLAERLYRVTGAGLYRDSLLVGADQPLKKPLLNARVLGSDSVHTTVHRGRLFWFWGDTNRPGYPLGNFHVPGATSDHPGKGGLPPDRGVDLHYFVDAKTGFAAPTAADMPGKGPTWLTALVSLPDAKGRDQLLAAYVKVEPPLKVHARGLMVFDDEAQKFRHAIDIPLAAPVFPHGHTFRHRAEGNDYLYIGDPFPFTRVKAHAESFLDPKAYETFTCLVDGTDPKEGKLDRDEKGKLRWAWRKNTAPVGPELENRWLRLGKMQAEEARWRLLDRTTGKFIHAHRGSVYWNAFRKRWILIATQVGGTSMLGEVWYAEADHPTGPWRNAVKIVTHDRYSFYNPTQHPALDQAGGRFIYFEGTYTHTFSGNSDATPRYDYNQVMYRLDLTDPRLRSESTSGKEKAPR